MSMGLNLAQLEGGDDDRMTCTQPLPSPPPPRSLLLLLTMTTVSQLRSWVLNEGSRGVPAAAAAEDAADAADPDALDVAAAAADGGDDGDMSLGRIMRGGVDAGEAKGF